MMIHALYERRGKVGIVTLNRPERLNAINGDLLAALTDALDRAVADENCHAIVLKGAGRAFCSGDDLKEFDIQSENSETIAAHIGAIQKITRQMMGCHKPIVGAIHGYAVGGGFEWLLNCDIVVASSDLIAFFPEMDWGQFVTGGVTHLLPQSVGHQRAMELILLGERQTAARLEQFGLVNRVVTKDVLEATALGLAEKVAEKSPFSVARLKTLLTMDLGQALWRAVELEQAIAIESFAQENTAERTSAFGRRNKSV
jgi:enoyl-CoA hydratase/carnithine racemase